MAKRGTTKDCSRICAKKIIYLLLLGISNYNRTNPTTFFFEDHGMGRYTKTKASHKPKLDVELILYHDFQEKHQEQKNQLRDREKTNFVLYLFIYIVFLILCGFLYSTAIFLENQSTRKTHIFDISDIFGNLTKNAYFRCISDIFGKYI